MSMKYVILAFVFIIAAFVFVFVLDVVGTPDSIIKYIFNTKNYRSISRLYSQRRFQMPSGIPYDQMRIALRAKTKELWESKNNDSPKTQSNKRMVDLVLNTPELFDKYINDNYAYSYYKHERMLKDMREMEQEKRSKYDEGVKELEIIIKDTAKAKHLAECLNILLNASNTDNIKGCFSQINAEKFLTFTGALKASYIYSILNNRLGIKFTQSDISTVLGYFNTSLKISQGNISQQSSKVEYDDLYDELSKYMSMK